VQKKPNDEGIQGITFSEPMPAKVADALNQSGIVEVISWSENGLLTFRRKSFYETEKFAEVVMDILIKRNEVMSRELAKAIEDYIVALKRSLDYVSKNADMLPSLVEGESEAQTALQSIFYKVSEEDITQLFADLRDYWDTLEVGK
jgi:hypothetical protein